MGTKKTIYRENIDVLTKFRRDCFLSIGDKTRALMIDGPISDQYDSSYKKIMWVLREPHSSAYKGLDLETHSLINYVRNGFKDTVNGIIEVDPYRYWASTFGLIIKVSYRILQHLQNINPSKRLLQFKPSNNLEKQREVLKQVAIINLNKYGGGRSLSKHFDKGIKKGFEATKWQFENLKPNIVIYGKTFHPAYRYRFIEFPKHLELSEYEPTQETFPLLIDDQGVKHISAYHPNARLKHDQYVLNIMRHIQ